VDVAQERTGRRGQRDLPQAEIVSNAAQRQTEQQPSRSSVAASARLSVLSHRNRRSTACSVATIALP
jgi:hypothetical protein